MTNPSMLIEPATPSDLPAILALEQTGFPPLSRWIDKSWLPELTGSHHFTPGARDHAGVLRGVAAFQLIAEVAELNRVVVDPEHQGRGTGRALLAAGLGWAARNGGERMLLEVEWANEPALALYRGLGFVEITFRTNYYGAGRDALVMQRDLLPSDLNTLGELTR